MVHEGDDETAQDEEEIDPGMAEPEDIAKGDETQVLRQREGSGGVIDNHQHRGDATRELDTSQRAAFTARTG